MARRSRGVASERSVGTRIVGATGELLLTVGVLAVLFLVWDLWWTGLEADRDREQSAEEFVARLEALESPQQRPDAGESEDDIAELAAQGEVMAMVYAPRLGDEWTAPVLPGVEAESLNRAGLGHYSSTQLPGEPGNFALAGHRQTYGAILWDQDTFVVGDPIYIQSSDGWYTYRVTETYVVSPDQSEVLAPVPGSPGEDPEDASVLTLTTCHPPYTTLDRMITHAELVDHDPLDQGPPAEVADLVDQASSDSAAEQRGT